MELRAAGKTELLLMSRAKNGGALHGDGLGNPGLGSRPGGDLLLLHGSSVVCLAPIAVAYTAEIVSRHRSFLSTAINASAAAARQYAAAERRRAW